MTETEKMTKVERKAQKVKQAQAEYRKAVREQKKQERKTQDRHKYMMDGCVLKYFPEELSAFDFDEQEMNRIIACAFSLRDVKNMILSVWCRKRSPASRPQRSGNSGHALPQQSREFPSWKSCSAKSMRTTF